LGMSVRGLKRAKLLVGKVFNISFYKFFAERIWTKTQKIIADFFVGCSAS